VKAKELDARTDLFSFGAVLYEMATGRMPFEGESSGEICGAILHKEPTPPAELNPQVSAGLGAVIDKALEKDRNLRYQHASEMLTDLQRLKRDSDSGRHVAARSSTPAAGVQMAEAPPSPSGVAAPPRRRWSVIAGAIVVLISALVAGGLYYRSKKNRPKLTEKDTIVVADFDNKTGDGVFDDALKQALAVELEQSPFLNVLSERKVSEALQMMGHPANYRLTLDVGRELCLRTGSKALLGGTISSLGSHYLIDLNAVACSTGDTLAKEQAEATSKEDVLKALSRASSNLRSKLGESLASVQKFDVPVEATTSSLEALKNYSMGLKTRHDTGAAPSIPFMQKAIELDPNFPMAYASLAETQYNLQQVSLAQENAAKAYQLRNRASEREKLAISATYFAVMGEVEKSVQTLELWAATYPRDVFPHARLGATYGGIGRLD